MALKKITIETVDRWGEPAVEVRYRHEDDPQIDPNGKAFDDNWNAVVLALVVLAIFSVIAVL